MVSSLYLVSRTWRRLVCLPASWHTVSLASTDRFQTTSSPIVDASVITVLCPMVLPAIRRFVVDAANDLYGWLLALMSLTVSQLRELVVIDRMSPESLIVLRDCV